MTRNIIVPLSAACVLVALSIAPRATAQQAVEAKQQREPQQVQTFVLKNVNSMNQLNDIQTALRNVVGRVKFFGLSSSNSLVASGSAEDLDTVKRLIGELDRPVKAYQVTYTVSRMDGGKRSGSRQYSMTVLENEGADLKKGNRVPIVTGSYATQEKQSAPETQFQYLDVGVNIRCTVTSTAVRTKFELTSVSEEKSNVGIQDPIIGQTFMESNSAFVAGKSQVIGAIDEPGTNQRDEIELKVEPL